MLLLAVVAVLPAGGARLPQRRRRLRGGHPRTSARPPALVVASALLVDYVMTVAVSVAAGVTTSSRRSRSCNPYRVLDVARFRRAADRDEPARRSRIRAGLRRPDLPLRRRRDAHDRHRAVPAVASATRRWPRARNYGIDADTGYGLNRAWRSLCLRCGLSPPAAPRSPASRPSPTACRRSSRRRRATPPHDVADGRARDHDVRRHHRARPVRERPLRRKHLRPLGFPELQTDRSAP